jgi:hypothetical protein
VRTLSFLGGVPEVLVPDNLKAGVKSPDRYEPDLNPSYQEFARHYGVAVVPARVRKPKDKAKVESGVQVVERWILARLRDQTLFSLGELNRAIRELLEELNNRLMRHLGQSRCEDTRSHERDTFGTSDFARPEPEEQVACQREIKRKLSCSGGQGSSAFGILWAPGHLFPLRVI